MGDNSGQPVRPMVQKAHFQKNFAEQTSTNDYVTLDSVWDKSGFQTATIQIWNSDTEEDNNDVYYKILGSLNGTDYDIEIIGETTLEDDDYDLIDISNLSEGAYIPFIKIQIKSKVADNHSTVKAFGVCI
jgi:hypothetical protein